MCVPCKCAWTQDQLRLHRLATGLNDAGEELQRLLSDCAAGDVSVIYISSRDRISRDGEKLARFVATAEDHDVVVIFLEDAVGMAVDKV